MNLKSCERKEKSTAELIVEVGADEFGAAINESYIRNRKHISVPGFRKGKAPRKIIESMYGASVFYNDALDIILPTVVSFALNETELKLASLPKINDFDIKEDGSAEFTIVAAIYPEITIGEYKGLSTRKQAAVVDESEVDSEIAAIQLRNARIESVTRPAIGGDTTIIDFEGFIDGEPFDGGKGEDYELVLGSNSFIPGFEEKMHGMTIGEERELDLVFPDNYTEHLAGKPVVFKVKLKELKAKILPELDDEFAKDVSEFDTFEEYRADIRQKFEEEARRETDKTYDDALLSMVISTIEGDIPDEMVDEYLDNTIDRIVSQFEGIGIPREKYFQMVGTTEEGYRAVTRQNAEYSVKSMLVIDKIAELENIVISDEDIETGYNESAELYGMDVEDVKKYISRDEMENDVRTRLVTKIIRENSVPVESYASGPEMLTAEEKAEEDLDTKQD